MKKLLLFLLVPYLFAGLSVAGPVDKDLAQKVAITFYNQSVKNVVLADAAFSLAYTETTKQMSDLKVSGDQEQPVFYIFNVSPNNGFVIVSADDHVLPVLGYSTKGSYDSQKLPPPFRKLLELYKDQIRYVMVNKLESSDRIDSEWANLRNGQKRNPSKSPHTVDPLLQTTWNQFPYESEMCPVDASGPGGHCVTGCPATAMAQIMKYYNYPTTGTGFHSYNDNPYGTLSADFGNTTYNWTNMPNHLDASNDAVALLMFHCGVAVEMNYGPNGSFGWVIQNDNSGNHPACCEVAYPTYFGYKSTLQGLMRANYSDADWKQKLKTDLDASHPVQYAGFGTGGHTWVCDGYDANDYFDMNWGWGGQANGFFDLDALNPGTEDFNSNQQALFGIEPGSNGGGGGGGLDAYSALTVNPNPIQFSQGFTVNVDIINDGTTTFSGDYCAALFNSDGNFIDFVETLTGASLAPGYHYTNGLTFTSSGIAAATPGNYTIGIYSRPTGGGWTIIGAGNYANQINVVIQGTANSMELYSTMTVSVNPIIVNQPFTVTASIANTGTSTFNGNISLDLHASDGTWIQTVQEYDNVTLQAGYYFNNAQFATTGMNVSAGTYYLVLWDQVSGGQWELLGSGSYSNPIQVLINDVALQADAFEPNNTAQTATDMPLSFNGNQANVNTTGSNIHNGSDVDYYKVSFPAGYSYDINARVWDSYAGGNGQTYTCDVMFSYYNGSKWSDAYDATMPSDIILPNGGALTFFVFPYFPGATGTYLLDINITRNPAGIDEPGASELLQVFPNPVQTVATFRFNLKSPVQVTGSLNNIAGQKVMDIEASLDSGQQDINLDVSQLPAGIYTYQVNTGKERASGKMVIVR